MSKQAASLITIVLSCLMLSCGSGRVSVREDRTSSRIDTLSLQVASSAARSHKEEQNLSFVEMIDIDWLVLPDSTLALPSSIRREVRVESRSSDTAVWQEHRTEDSIRWSSDSAAASTESTDFQGVMDGSPAPRKVGFQFGFLLGALLVITIKTIVRRFLK